MSKKLNTEEKISRKQQILQTLAMQLEISPGKRITTAALAEAVGVSEAALYRHFPSKARMYEALIEFIEETIFGLIRQILNDDPSSAGRCQKIAALLLTFSSKNPGISRILSGDALTGEHDRLRQRVDQIFNRIETQFKQILREGNMQDQLLRGVDVNVTANLLVTLCEGGINRFVRSRFNASPLEYWEKQWLMIFGATFRSP